MMSIAKFRRVAWCLVILLLTNTLRAQEAKADTPPSNDSHHSIDVYKIEYVFSESQDGKRVNNRSYTMLVRIGEKGSIRLGSRIPITYGASTQMQYMDVGVNIDTQIEWPIGAGVGADSFIALTTILDITRLAPEQAGETRGSLPPIVRQTKIQERNMVPLGKQTLLSTADEVDGTGTFQIEVKATKVR